MMHQKIYFTQTPTFGIALSTVSTTKELVLLKRPKLQDFKDEQLWAWIT